MKTDTKKHFSFLEWVTVIGVSLLFLFTLYTGSEEIFKKPIRDQFCKEITMQQDSLKTKVSCEKESGTWIHTEEEMKKLKFNDYCDLQKKCDNEFEKVHKTYTVYEYIFIGVGSLFGILIGYFLRKKSELASFALIAASLFSIIISHITHWELVNGYARPAILLCALSLLMYGIIKRDSFRKQ